MTFNKLNWTVALEVTSSFPSETTSITSLKTSNFQLKLPFCRCCISYYHSYLDFIISKPTWTRTTQQTRTHDRVKKNLFITFKTLGISVPVFIVQEAFRDVTLNIQLLGKSSTFVRYQARVIIMFRNWETEKRMSDGWERKIIMYLMNKVEFFLVDYWARIDGR